MSSSSLFTPPFLFTNTLTSPSSAYCQVPSAYVQRPSFTPTQKLDSNGNYSALQWKGAWFELRLYCKEISVVHQGGQCPIRSVSLMNKQQCKLSILGRNEIFTFSPKTGRSVKLISRLLQVQMLWIRETIDPLSQYVFQRMRIYSSTALWLHAFLQICCTSVFTAI